MNYGLTERNMKTLNGIFEKYKSLKKVILYGSRAMGNYKNGSDIDITFEVDENFTRTDLLRISGDLSESDLPYFVDCSIFSEISNPDLKDHIARVGKVLYENKN